MHAALSAPLMTWNQAVYASDPDGSRGDERAGCTRVAAETTPERRRQPPREGPVADACERMQPTQGDHLTGPEAGLGRFEEACQMVSNLTAEGRDTRDGRGHRRLRSWQGCTLSTSVEDVYGHDNKTDKY